MFAKQRKNRYFGCSELAFITNPAVLRRSPASTLRPPSAGRSSIAYRRYTASLPGELSNSARVLEAYAIPLSRVDSETSTVPCPPA